MLTKFSFMGELSLLNKTLYVLLRFATYGKKFEWNFNQSSVKNRGLVTQLCGLYALMCLEVYGFTRAASCRALAAVCWNALVMDFTWKNRTREQGSKKRAFETNVLPILPWTWGFSPPLECVCERGLVGGKFPVIPFIQPGLRTSIYLHLQLFRLQTQHNLKLSLMPTWGHLTSCS